MCRLEIFLNFPIAELRHEGKEEKGKKEEGWRLENKKWMAEEKRKKNGEERGKGAKEIEPLKRVFEEDLR